jgi:hypothetical protein
MVKNVWERPVAGHSPIQRWNKKMRATRRYLDGWARHMAGQLTAEKLGLSSVIIDIEAIAKVRPLTMQEIELKNQSNAKLASIRSEEELKR